MKIRFFYALICLLLLFPNLSHSQINRMYEPIILTGSSLSDLPNRDVTHLYLFSYHAGSDTWNMIPFQIDEVNPDVEDSLKYFVPENDMAGIFDANDELVFMANDLGDRADSLEWAANTDTIRYEILIFDSFNKYGYVYLYHSTEITDPIPNTYAMAYDAANDRVSSANYEVGFNSTGQLSDVSIKSPAGAGEDIFDRIKIRAIGSLWILPIFLDEELIRMGYAYAKTGPVRVIRNMFGYFQYEALEVNEAFTQTAFFYPWNGTFRLVEIPVEDAKQYGAEIDIIRVSWDFNHNASGMKFFSENNRAGVTIDGDKTNDAINSMCQPDELNWTMGAGNQGALLNVFYIPPLGDNIRIYYHEATDGSTGDLSALAFDTGDDSSFADSGFSLDSNIENYVTDSTTFNFIYYNYFLPANFSPDAASLLCEQLKSPVDFHARTQTKFTQSALATLNDGRMPVSNQLDQNYPNPFNAATLISFSIMKHSHVILNIFDSVGRLVATLVNAELAAGSYQYHWAGRDQQGRSVPSGIYFYQMSTDSFSATKKLIIIQ
ncbi:MAG: T9SS type A sorting domain-containing protein [Candidatus Zhuqueibacterota bacterium]